MGKIERSKNAKSPAHGKGKKKSRVVDEEIVEVQNRRGNIRLVSRPVQPVPAASTFQTCSGPPSASDSRQSTGSLKRPRPSSMSPDQGGYYQFDDENGRTRAKRKTKVSHNF
jgi:hypothetical protein